MEVLGCMFAGRFIATSDMTADEAESQVNPPSTRLEALLASLRGSGFNVTNQFEMLAEERHHDLFGKIALG